MKKRIGILTGGGDVPALNAVIAAAWAEAASRGVELVGILKGWEGALEGRFVDLSAVPVDPRIGGTILKSSRLDVRKIGDAPSRILANFHESGLSGLIAVGGEDTLSCSFLFPAFPQVLISKTIDNDVGQWSGEAGDFRTERVLNYFTLGFPTAAERIISFVSLGEGLRTTAYSHERIIIVESMGMHAGWLALASSLGRPDFIILPEFPLRYEDFAAKAAAKYSEQRHLIVVIAEGASYADGGYVRAEGDDPGGFGHPRFGGAAQVLGDRLRADIPGYSRFRNVNAVNPSYLYRSGAPNRLDRTWAEALGRRAVRNLAEGQDGPVFLAVGKTRRGFSVRQHVLSRFSSMDELHRLVHRGLYDPDAYAATPLARSYFLEFLQEIPFEHTYGFRG